MTPSYGCSFSCSFGGEDLQGQLPRRSVDAEAGDVPAPALRLLPAVLQGAEAPSFKEALAHVLDVALDMRLVLWSPHPRRVGDKAACLAVFEEATGETGR